MSEALTRETRDLRDVANAEYAQFLKGAMVGFNAAFTAIRAANDPDSAGLNLLCASEELERQLKAFSGKMRATLFSEMQSTGQFQVEGDGVVAELRAGATRGAVTDAKVLQAAMPELFVPQPDKVDAACLTKMLKAGMTVPGAELTTGAPTLAIRRI